MASVKLGRAELSLLADRTGTSVVSIPHLVAAPYSIDRDRAFVRFAGDTYPTGFHGEGRALSFALSCLYPRALQSELRALQVLLDEVAPASPDQRLLLRTHFALAVGLNVSVAVELDGPLQITPSASTSDAAFTVRVVEHSFAA